MFDFTLVTYKDLPDLDPDDELLKWALLARGMSVQAAVWNDPTVDWKKSGICVVRSTWDYHCAHDEFVEWMNRVDSLSTLMNPFKMMKWNSRKTYLKDLANKGIPIVPTVFLEPGENRPSVQDILDEFGWSEGVLKPTVGLATSGVRRVSSPSADPEGDELHVTELLASGTTLLQEFMSEVHGSGERALVFIGGEYTHCVKKAAFQKLAVAGHAGERISTVEPDELEIARLVLSTLDTVPLYARVDLIRDSKGLPALMELELIEPSLFLTMNIPAAERFAGVLCAFRAELLLTDSAPTGIHRIPSLG